MPCPPQSLGLVEMKHRRNLENSLCVALDTTNHAETCCGTASAERLEHAHFNGAR